jgi:alkaline phosphatase
MEWAAMINRLSRLPVALGGLGAVVVLGVGASFAVGGTGNPTNDTRSALDGHKPKNVILLIGDGMGTQEITAARYYNGVSTPLNVDRLKFTGFDTTWSVKPAASAPYTPDLDPDSASTGTEWATGSKTLDERISQGPSSAIGVPGSNTLKTVLESWQDAGAKVGDVSTAEITDATPAVQASHISLRGCQGPNDMASCPTSEGKAGGGLGSIAEQEVDHEVDVLLGGGRNRFDDTIAGGPDNGKTVIQSAQDKGYEYVTDATGLAAVTDATKPVLGLFTGGNMTTEFDGGVATLGAGTTTTCSESHRPAAEPALEAMTTKALDLLENPNGFFLQVEGASIDKQDHAANACGQIGETLAFDRAIGVALDYQAAHPDTLVVVTADHAHTSQIVADDASGTGLPTGYSTKLTTHDGATLALTYGTAGFGGTGNAPGTTPPSQQHTGSVVPVWAAGPQAAAVLGTNDHTDLYDLLRGAKVSQDAPSTTTTVTTTNTVTGPTTTVAGPTKTVTGPTKTVTGPTTTVPAKPGAPRIGLAIGTASRKAGIAVSVAAVDAQGVKLTLKQGGRTLASKNLDNAGGPARLDASKARKGTVTVTATATGEGGSAKKSASVKLTR